MDSVGLNVRGLHVSFIRIPTQHPVLVSVEVDAIVTPDSNTYSTAISFTETLRKLHKAVETVVIDNGERISRFVAGTRPMNLGSEITSFG